MTREAPLGPADALVTTARNLVMELAPGRDLVIEGIGWATVELERAEAALGAALGGALKASFRDADPESILGARARVGHLVRGVRVVLLEPSTEGRLAAFLARRGEGLATVYVSDPKGIDLRLAAGHDARRLLRPGPLGLAWPIAGDRDGPFLIRVPPGHRSASSG